jgi:hypothetical protein
MQQQSKAESDVHRFNWNMLTRGQVQGDQIRRIFAQSAIVFGDFSAIFRRFFGDFSAIFRRFFGDCFRRLFSANFPPFGDCFLWPGYRKLQNLPK